MPSLTTDPIALPLVQSAQASAEDEIVMVTLHAVSDRERLIEILVPMTDEAADSLAGQLTACAKTVRNRRRYNR
jgi:hypothetical protein